MKKLLILIFVFSTVCSFAQIFQWAKSMGAYGYYDTGKSVETDSHGNVFTLGYFKDTANFDPGVSNASFISNGFVAFITKHDANGNFIWVRCIEKIYGYGILIDQNDNLLITGTYEPGADFDPGPAVFNFSNGYGSYVLKLNNSGSFLWAKSFGDGAGTSPYSIEKDIKGNLYVCGTYYTSPGLGDFDPGSGVFNLAANLTSNNSFILKLDSTGNFILAKALHGNAECYSVAVDTLQNIFLTGSFKNAVDFDPGMTTYTLTSMQSSQFSDDAFVLMLNNLGNFGWVRRIGNSFGDHSFSVVTDNHGSIYITGYYNQGGNSGVTMGFDNSPGTPIVNCNSKTAFIAKYDLFGSLIWVKNPGTGSVEEGTSLAIDPAGNIYILGLYNGTVDFGGNAGILMNGTYGDTFILKMNSSGTSLCVGSIKRWLQDPVSQTMAVDLNQNVYITGITNKTFDVDPGPMTYYLQNAKNYDAFVLKMTTPFVVGDIELSQENNVMSVYPNPSNGSFTIKSEKELKLNLTNSLGQILQIIELNRANNFEIKTELFSSGIYFLSGIDEHQSAKQKIIITK